MIQGLLHIPLDVPSENGTPLSSPLSSHSQHTPYAAVCTREFSGNRETEVRECMTVLGGDGFQQRASRLCSCPSTPVTATRKLPPPSGWSQFYWTLVVRTGTTSYLCISASSKRGEKNKKKCFHVSRKVFIIGVYKAYYPEHSRLIVYPAYFNLFKLARIILFRLKIAIFTKKKTILEDAQVSNTYHNFFDVWTSLLL